MNTIILVGPPDRHKGPLCLCKCSHCCQCSQYVLRSSSASVLPCNDGLDIGTALCPLYEGKDQDGKCRFVRFFEPVVIASTQTSSVGVTVRYCTSAAAIASNWEDEARLDVRASNFWCKGQKAFFDIRVFYPIVPSYRQKDLISLPNAQIGKETGVC